MSTKGAETSSRKSPRERGEYTTPPPGLKESSEVMRLVELEKVELGSVVRLTLEPKSSRCQGTVYTVDPVTHTLVIFNRVNPNSTECELRLVPSHSIKKIEVLREALDNKESSIGPLPAIDQAEHEKREREAFEAMERAMEQLNPNATPEGQFIFDALARTLECTWKQNSIIVLEQVRIDPPYETTTCHSLDGDQSSLERIQKIITGLKKRHAKQQQQQLIHAAEEQRLASSAAEKNASPK